MHNVMSTIAAASSSAQERKRFRPNHESGLLPLLKLEVLVNEDVTNNDDDDGEPEEDTTSLSGTSSSSRVVYSSPTMMRSVQPAWEHLDERIDLPGEWWLRDPVYKTMRLRVTEIISDEEDRDESASSSTTFNNNNNKRSRFFLEIPLHPTKLERLHRDDAPDALPPNACLVYFSDGSTRCTYALFSVLLKHKLTEPSPIEDFSRFEDDVFRTLDGVPQTPDRRLRSESVSALLEPQDLNNRLIDEFDGPDEQMDSLNTDDIDFSESDESAIQKDIDNERERLLALIAREEFQFNTEVERLNEVRVVILFPVVIIFFIESHTPCPLCT